MTPSPLQPQLSQQPLAHPLYPSPSAGFSPSGFSPTRSQTFDSFTPTHAPTPSFGSGPKKTKKSTVKPQTANTGPKTSGAKASGAKTKKKVSRQPEPEQTEKTQTKAKAKPEKNTKGIGYWAQSILYSAAGLALIAAPFLIQGGFIATIGLSLLAILAKDIISLNAAKRGIQDFSDTRILKEFLDKRIDGFLDKASSLLFWKSAEKKKTWKAEWREIYDRTIGKVLDLLADTEKNGKVPELHGVADKLKNRSTLFGKLEVLLVVGLSAFKRSFVTGGRAKIAVMIPKLLKKGSLTALFTASLLWIGLRVFDFLFDTSPSVAPQPSKPGPAKPEKPSSPKN
ncbi:MAG: hypothetical protein K2X01_05500 [Cyanobacteria bacterium]|nr:hypothetical protein [Cyanobacteriota bacterium]